MCSQFSATIENVLASLEKTVQLASEYGNDDLQRPDIYTSLAKDICDLEKRNQQVLNALDQSKDEENIQNFEKIYKNAMDICPRRSKHSKRYSNFVGAVNQHLATTSSRTSQQRTIQVDEVVFDDFVSDIDPITKKPMEHPVKNKKCGHYYEKTSVLEAIKINRKLKCAVAGCGNKTPIMAAMLEDDHAFRKYLKERRKRQEDSD